MSRNSFDPAPLFDEQFLETLDLGSLKLGTTIYNYDDQYFAPPLKTDKAREAAYEAHIEALKINERIDHFEKNHASADELNQDAESLFNLFQSEFCTIFKELPNENKLAGQYCTTVLKDYLIRNYKDETVRKNLLDLTKTILCAAFYFTHDEDGKTDEERFPSALARIVGTMNLACVDGNISALNDEIARYRFPKSLYVELRNLTIAKNVNNIYSGNHIHFPPFIDYASGNEGENLARDNNLFFSSSSLTLQDTTRIVTNFNLRGLEFIIDFFADKFIEIIKEIEEENPQISEDEFTLEYGKKSLELGLEPDLFIYLMDEQGIRNNDELLLQKIKEYFLENPLNQEIVINDQEVLNKLQLINIITAFAKRNITLPIWLTSNLQKFYPDEPVTEGSGYFPKLLNRLARDLESKNIRNGTNRKILHQQLIRAHQIKREDSLQDLINHGATFEQIENYINTHQSDNPQPWLTRIMVNGVQLLVPQVNIEGLLFHPKQEEILFLLQENGIAVTNSLINRAIILGDIIFLENNIDFIEEALDEALARYQPFLTTLYLPQLAILASVFVNSEQGLATFQNKILKGFATNPQGQLTGILTHVFYENSNQDEVLDWLEQIFDKKDYFGLVFSQLLFFIPQSTEKHLKTIANHIKEADLSILDNVLNDANNPYVILNAAKICEIKNQPARACDYYEKFLALPAANIAGIDPSIINEIKFHLAGLYESLPFKDLLQNYEDCQIRAHGFYNELASLNDGGNIAKKARLAIARFYEKGYFQPSSQPEFKKAFKKYKLLEQDEDLEIRNMARFKTAYFIEKGLTNHKPQVKTAFAFYQTLERSEQKNFDAIERLIICYKEGIGTAINDDEAFELCKKYASQSPKIMAQLMECYIYGIGTEQDPQKIDEIYNQFPKQAEIIYAYAKFLQYREEDVEENLLENLFETAHELGNHAATFEFCKIMIDDKSAEEQKTAWELIDYLTKEQYVPALLYSAEYHYYDAAYEEREISDLTEEEIAQENVRLQNFAKDLYLTAANLGSEEAMYELAEIYYSEKDLVAANKYAKLFSKYTADKNDVLRYNYKTERCKEIEEEFKKKPKNLVKNSRKRKAEKLDQEEHKDVLKKS